MISGRSSAPGSIIGAEPASVRRKSPAGPFTEVEQCAGLSTRNPHRTDWDLQPVLFARARVVRCTRGAELVPVRLRSSDKPPPSCDHRQDICTSGSSRPISTTPMVQPPVYRITNHQNHRHGPESEKTAGIYLVAEDYHYSAPPMHAMPPDTPSVSHPAVSMRPCVPPRARDENAVMPPLVRRRSP